MLRFGKKLERFIPKKIWHQVGLVFALILTISLSVLGWLLITRSEKAVGDSVTRDYREIINVTAREIGNFINRPKNLLVTMASIFSTISVKDIDAQKVILYQLIMDNPTFFEKVAIADSNGKELVSSDLPASKAPKDYSQRDVFRAVSDTQAAAISKAYFSNDHFPYMTIAVPIKKLNQMDRVLIAEVKLSSIWDIVSNVKLDGNIFLVDERANTLVHTEEKKVYTGENLSGSAALQSVLKGSESAEENSYDKETQEWSLNVYAPIAPLGWALGFRQLHKSAFAFSLLMQRTAVIVIALAVIVSILLSLAIARWIVNPIRQLTEMTGQVAAGDLDQEIKVGRNDEIGKLMASFNAMTKGLKKAKRLEKLSAIGVATSKITHELRNPLVAVKTFMQLLPRRYHDEKFIAQFNENVPSEMLRLERMLGTLSEFSKVQQLYLGEHDIVALIKSSVTLLSMQLEQQKVNVATVFESEKIILRVDGDKIKQVLINLIRNACDAMPQGGKLTISSRISPNGQLIQGDLATKGWAEIRIADTGCGMSKETLANIFEPFFTSKRGGLGLGLTICQEIIEQHHGVLDAESTKDKGTTFIIRLPLGT